MSYEVLVEADFLTLGHCLCVNQSLALLEDQFMTRWFSLDLRSSAERREAGNISGGDQKGLQQRSARTHCMLRIWHASSHYGSLSLTHTVSPLLIRDVNILHAHARTHTVCLRPQNWTAPFQKDCAGCFVPGGLFCTSSRHACQTIHDYTGETELWGNWLQQCNPSVSSPFKQQHQWAQRSN